MPQSKGEAGRVCRRARVRREGHAHGTATGAARTTAEARCAPRAAWQAAAWQGAGRQGGVARGRPHVFDALAAGGLASGLAGGFLAGARGFGGAFFFGFTSSSSSLSSASLPSDSELSSFFFRARGLGGAFFFGFTSSTSSSSLSSATAVAAELPAFDLGAAFGFAAAAFDGFDFESTAGALFDRPAFGGCGFGRSLGFTRICGDVSVGVSVSVSFSVGVGVSVGERTREYHA